MLVNYPTEAINTPSVQTGTTVLASNPNRIGWRVQNSGTAVLFLAMGAITASATSFHIVLPACTAQDDGTGGNFTQTNGVIFTGQITSFISSGTSRYVVAELAP